VKETNEGKEVTTVWKNEKGETDKTVEFYPHGDNGLPGESHTSSTIRK